MDNKIILRLSTLSQRSVSRQLSAVSKSNLSREFSLELDGFCLESNIEDSIRKLSHITDSDEDIKCRQPTIDTQDKKADEKASKYNLESVEEIATVFPRNSNDPQDLAIKIKGESNQSAYRRREAASLSSRINRGKNLKDARQVDLKNSSKQDVKPFVMSRQSEMVIPSSNSNQCQLVSTQLPKQQPKRIKCVDITSGDSIESHEIEELICSCKGKVNQNLKEVIDLKLSDVPKEDPVNVFSPRNRILTQPHKLVSLGERNGRSICNKHMPWFGIDVGGSLIKVVFFDPKEATREEMVTLKRTRRYLKSSKPYGTTGKRDTHLEMPNCVINKRVGSLHFIRFATSQMPEFLSMAKNKRFADTINTVCATGGGAYKFEEDIKTNLGITLHKTDELDSIIYGIHYIDKYNSDRECYYLEDPLDDAKCVKVPYDFSRPYPYLVVNIGSGVSILAVYSSTSYSRISGSSIGGGTFLGLCCLLTQCKTFDEAIRLAKAGSSSRIDKLVKDIYGGDYPKFNLSGDTVASSFGHMNMAEKRNDVRREDVARALLEMVTINIGSIARMCAANEDIDRVVFIGNFLRVNQLSMKLLSYAVNYWSKGAMKALFLEHEGYFGAVGCFVESTQGCHH